MQAKISEVKFFAQICYKLRQNSTIKENFLTDLKFLFLIPLLLYLRPVLILYNCWKRRLLKKLKRIVLILIKLLNNEDRLLQPNSNYKAFINSRISVV